MNGYIVISLDNGLMLLTHTINNYGLPSPASSSSSPSSMSDPLEISSFLYAIYTLSKSYYEDQEGDDDQGDSISGAGMISGSIVTGFRESPISYFQHESIFWHFYESCGKDSGILTIVSSNCQVDHQYALLFAAKLSQNFLSTRISDCVSPRSGISKQVKENYKELLELRVKEIIYYLFDNLFVCSSSLGLIYVAEECSSMISSYQLQERGKYIIEANELDLLAIVSSQWNEPSSSRVTAKEEHQKSEGEVEVEGQGKGKEQRISPPILSSVSEAKLHCPSSVSTNRPYSAGDALHSSNSMVVQEEAASENGFLKSSIQWVKRRFNFKRKKSQTNLSNSVVTDMGSNVHQNIDHMTSGERSRSMSGPLELPSDERKIEWQLFHLDEQHLQPHLQQQQEQERRDSGYPDLLSASSVPWLLQLIETYQKHHLHISHQDRISSLTTSLPPFILTTSFPASLTEATLPPASNQHSATASPTDQWIHLFDISSSLYSSLSSRNLNVFLVWNESIGDFSPPPAPSASGNEEVESSRLKEGIASKENITKIFQSTSELKLLFLELLELNLELHKY